MLPFGLNGLPHSYNKGLVGHFDPGAAGRLTA